MRNKWTLMLAAFCFTACGPTTKSDQGESKKESVTTEKEGYQLVWSDEFDYEGLPDSTKWEFDTQGNAHGWGNNELQFYTEKRKDNASVANGFLSITARKEPMNEKAYSSARLRTKGKGDWKYGRYEIRAKLPKGLGIWPAIWMLPTDWVYGGWPKSGEIDIMEHVGYEPDSVFASSHTETYNHAIGTNKTKGIAVKNLYDDFHIYALEWNEQEYSVFMDDEKYFTFKNEGSGAKEWPYDQPFHLLLNVAVGGNWGGKHGVDDRIFPQSMVVDYVRVYQEQ